MNPEWPRLRMFAGPNGSGKSTIKNVIRPELVGYYVNPDEIKARIEQTGELDFASFGIAADADDVLPILRSSPLLAEKGLAAESRLLRFEAGRLIFGQAAANAYFASAVSDLLRRRLLALRKSFTFETVMSAPDKVEFLAEAQRTGYRTYLYFVATEDPEINISRVRNRVLMGGHDVPEDRIVARYHRSLGFLMQAIRNTNRAYIFDNSSSGEDRLWIAEVTEGSTLEMKVDRVPDWFRRAVLDKIGVP